MRLIKITKIEKIDSPKDNNSETSPVGHSEEGAEYTHPYVNGFYTLYGVGGDERRKGIVTAQVTEIIDDSTFKTTDAIYKIEEIV